MLFRINAASLANYAKKKGMEYASVPLKDGTTFKFARKIGGTDEPNELFYAIMKNGEANKFKAFRGTVEGFAAYMENLFKEIQKYVKPGTNLSEEIDKQIMNKSFQEMI